MSSSKSMKTKLELTAQNDFAIKQPSSGAVPYMIHGPAPGDQGMSDRAYVLINVLPGQTAAVVTALG